MTPAAMQAGMHKLLSTMMVGFDCLRSVCSLNRLEQYAQANRPPVRCSSQTDGARLDTARRPVQEVELALEQLHIGPRTRTRDHQLGLNLCSVLQHCMRHLPTASAFWAGAGSQMHSPELEADHLQPSEAECIPAPCLLGEPTLSTQACLVQCIDNLAPCCYRQVPTIGFLAPARKPCSLLDTKSPMAGTHLAILSLK